MASGDVIVVYDGDAVGGSTFGAPLDPDTGAGGMAYFWDYSDELGSATIASVAVSVDSALSQVGTARIGTWSESTREFTASSGNQYVEVVLTNSTGTAGRSYPVTVTATDSNGLDGHIATMRVRVGNR